MAWASIGLQVVKSIVNAASSPNEKEKQSHEPYNLQGHFDGKPVNLLVKRGPQGQALNSPASTCNNCSKGAAKKETRRTNDNNTCLIKLPSEGNFEINIKKSESVLTAKKYNKNFNNQLKNNNDKLPDKKSKQQEISNTVRNYSNCNSKQKNPNKNQSKGKNGDNKQNKAAKTWMYIGRLKLGTSETDLQSYLTGKFPTKNFKIQQLPKYKDAKLPSFKVQVDNDILEEFKDASHWPCNITISIYNHNFKNN